MIEPLGSALKLCVLSSGSMRPAHETGDFLLIDESFTGPFRRGDLAALPAAAPSAGERIVHRVVAVRRDGDARWLTTKGDARLDADPEFLESRASGRAVFAGRAGQDWIRLDDDAPRWGAAAAAAAFARVASLQNPSAAWRCLERAALAVASLSWAEPALSAVHAATLRRRWAGARGLRRALLSAALAGERRLWSGPIVVRKWLNGLGCRAATCGLRAARRIAREEGGRGTAS